MQKCLKTFLAILMIIVLPLHGITLRSGVAFASDVADIPVTAMPTFSGGGGAPPAVRLGQARPYFKIVYNAGLVVIEWSSINGATEYMFRAGFIPPISINNGVLVYQGAGTSYTVRSQGADLCYTLFWSDGTNWCIGRSLLSQSYIGSLRRR